MMRQCLRLEQRQFLRAPIPPQGAARGIEGLRIADKILKEYKAVGILVGGLAKEIWSGTLDDNKFKKHKDVDVLVLSRDCKNHPLQWEGGIDWWIYHKINERPTNGGSITLFWSIIFRKRFKFIRLVHGLYLCPLDLLKGSINHEKFMASDEFIVRGKKMKEVQINEFQVFPREAIYTKYFNDEEYYDDASHCKGL